MTKMQALKKICALSEEDRKKYGHWTVFLSENKIHLAPRPGDYNSDGAEETHKIILYRNNKPVPVSMIVAQLWFFYFNNETPQEKKKTKRKTRTVYMQEGVQQ